MPGIATDPVFHLISVKELHPTFGAEISGVDFSREVPDDVFQEILAAITKVSISCPVYPLFDTVILLTILPASMASASSVTPASTTSATSGSLRSSASWTT